MIRITASLVHNKSGAELLRHDSLPVARAELRDALDDVVVFICNEAGYTIEEGDVHLLLRIESEGRGTSELLVSHSDPTLKARAGSSRRQPRSGGDNLSPSSAQ